MAKKPEKLMEFAEWIGADMTRAKKLEAEFHVAFPKEGVPAGAVSRFVDEVFPSGLVRDKLLEMVREHFTPAVEVEDATAKK